jgi:hypothetical protein
VLADWHYDFNDRRCPHDSSIRSLELLNDEATREFRAANLSLFGASRDPSHDRIISFSYVDVIDIEIAGRLIHQRNLDWIYDEIHLCESGSIEHIIEFEEAIVRVECADVHFSYEPVGELSGQA